MGREPESGRCPGTAGRPEYLTEITSYRDLPRATRLGHEREVEKIEWMARNGHLTSDEVETIERKAEEARERIGTGRERVAA